MRPPARNLIMMEEHIMHNARQRLGLLVIFTTVLLAACSTPPAAQGVAATAPAGATTLPTPPPTPAVRPALTAAPSAAAASATPALTAVLPVAGLTGRFAYNTPDGNIWVMNADGTHRVQVTRAGGNDLDPS